MTTDFRALCAELVNALAESLTWATIEDTTKGCEILARARAALADGPAVPEGREPTRDELWELWLRLNNELPDRPAAVAEFWEHAQINARARWGNPAPLPPAEGEVAELVAWLRMQGEAQKPGPNSLLCDKTKKELHANGTRLVCAAELLQRLSPPQPVPVSEQWPEFSDCDDTDRVWCWNWAVGDWRLNRINRSIHTHWLPAHALPIPHQQENHQ